MKTYVLKKDLPWARAGTEWRYSSAIISNEIVLENPVDKELFGFPRATIDEWFEEMEEVTITKKTSDVISSKIASWGNLVIERGTKDQKRKYQEFVEWLEESTV